MERSLSPRLVSDTPNYPQGSTTDVEKRQLTQTHEFGHGAGVHEGEPGLGDVEQILVLQI